MIPRFINPITQYGKTDYELIILNGENMIHRQFCSFGEKVTDEELQYFADKIITDLKGSQDVKYAELKTASFSKLVIDKQEEKIIDEK